jgi:hypothetical protein
MVAAVRGLRHHEYQMRKRHLRDIQRHEGWQLLRREPEGGMPISTGCDDGDNKASASLRWRVT